MITSKGGRVFLYCVDCRHWVGTSPLVCEHTCHRPSLLKREKELNDNVSGG